MAQLVEASVENHIAFLKITRKEAANALSNKLLEEMQTQLEEWQFDPSIRVLILSGDGERVFCAGADLKERSGMNNTQVRQAVNHIQSVINLLEDLPFPVIAALNGSAIGGGLELALACDFRIAADHARFAFSETSLGIIPGAGGTQRLPRIIGIQRAKEMIYTAKKISTATALEWGLILRAVPSNDVLTQSFRLAEEISKNGPIAVKQAKYAINQGIEVDLKTGLSIEGKAYEVIIPTKDRLEGLQAFKEKRPPIYIGE